MFESISQHIPGGNNRNYIKVFTLGANTGSRDLQKKRKRYQTIELNFWYKDEKAENIIQNYDTEISVRGHGQFQNERPR